MPTLLRAVLAVLCLAVAAYAVLTYALLPVGAAVHPDMRAGFEAHALAVRVHVFSALVALVLGPPQLSPRLRARWPHLHRHLGRAYLAVGVGVGGASGLVLAQHAFGGWPARLGFGLLACAWLATGWRALAAIRAGDVAAHQAWMTRNVALTLAAVTLRLYVPASLAARVPFEAAYPAIAWLCWVPNLLAAEWLVARGARASLSA